MENFKKLLNEFREWDRKWDLYAEGKLDEKPLSVEDFIQMLRKKYQVSIITSE